MNYNQNELKNIIDKLNNEINKWVFNIQLNEKIIQIIINMYKSANQWNISKTTILLEQLKIIYWVSNLQEYWNNKYENDNFDNKIEVNDNLCLEVEHITWEFLKNLKKYNENNK